MSSFNIRLLSPHQRARLGGSYVSYTVFIGKNRSRFVKTDGFAGLSSFIALIVDPKVEDCFDLRNFEVSQQAPQDPSYFVYCYCICWKTKVGHCLHIIYCFENA